MEELISRAAAIAKVEKARKAARTLTGMDFVMMLKAQPAVDAVPVVHGRWEPSGDYNGYCVCSVCHDAYIDPDWRADGKWGFCPNCGARMDGGEDDGRFD